MSKTRYNLFGDEFTQINTFTQANSHEAPIQTMAGLFEQIENGLKIMPEMLEGLKKAGTYGEAIEHAYIILETTRSWVKMLLAFNQCFEKFALEFETK